jgi:hypothetical protein
LRSNSAIQELKSRNSHFERPDDLDSPERPDGPGLPERAVWFGLIPVCFGSIEDSFAIPTMVAGVAGAAVELEASLFLRTPRQVVRMEARQTSAVVGQGEPVRRGRRRGEAVRSALGEWAPRLAEASGQALLWVSDQWV